VKFLSCAESKGYLEILTGNKVSPTDSEQPPSTTTAEQITKLNNLSQANKQGFIDLVLSVDGTTKFGRIAFSTVKGCRSGDKKPGYAALAWGRLSQKFEPKTAPSHINLKRIFTSMKMGTTEDPDNWLASLEDMRKQLINAGSTMTEIELLEHVFANLPKDYKVAANLLEKRLGFRMDPVTIKEIRHGLNLKYQKMYGVQKLTTHEESKTALYAGSFRGRCNECDKIGHRARDWCDRQEQHGKGNTYKN
jgi:hypothetical protein